MFFSEFKKRAVYLSLAKTRKIPIRTKDEQGLDTEQTYYSMQSFAKPCSN